jgi:hypothetical protein
MKVPAVTGIHLRNVPIRRMSCSSCMPWMTEPAPRNSNALKKRVRDHVEHRGQMRADARGEEHVAELADRRVRQHPFDVVLHDRDGRRSRAVIAPTHATTVPRDRTPRRTGSPDR